MNNISSKQNYFSTDENDTFLLTGLKPTLIVIQRYSYDINSQYRIEITILILTHPYP